MTVFVCRSAQDDARQCGEGQGSGDALDRVFVRRAFGKVRDADQYEAPFGREIDERLKAASRFRVLVAVRFGWERQHDRIDHRHFQIRQISRLPD